MNYINNMLKSNYLVSYVNLEHRRFIQNIPDDKICMIHSNNYDNLDEVYDRCVNDGWKYAILSYNLKTLVEILNNDNGKINCFYIPDITPIITNEYDVPHHILIKTVNKYYLKCNMTDKWIDVPEHMVNFNRHLFRCDMIEGYECDIKGDDAQYDYAEDLDYEEDYEEDDEDDEDEEED